MQNRRRNGINCPFGKSRVSRGTRGGPQKRSCRAKEFEEPACSRANRRNSKGYRKAFFHWTLQKKGPPSRHVFPSRGAAVYKSRCQFRRQRDSIGRSPLALPGNIDERRSTQLVTIVNSHQPMQTIGQSACPELLSSLCVHSSPKVHTNPDRFSYQELKDSPYRRTSINQEISLFLEIFTFNFIYSKNPREHT